MTPASIHVHVPERPSAWSKIREVLAYATLIAVFTAGGGIYYHSVAAQRYAAYEDQLKAERRWRARVEVALDRCMEAKRLRAGGTR